MVVALLVVVRSGKDYSEMNAIKIKRKQNFKLPTFAVKKEMNAILVSENRSTKEAIFKGCMMDKHHANLHIQTEKVKKSILGCMFGEKIS